MSRTVSMTPQGRFFDLPGANVSRYLWVSEHVKARRVIDYGCGHGYGAHFLSNGIADYVLGIDSDSKAIKFAREHYRGKNLEFTSVDLSKITIPTASFDAVVSFEVIEHIHDPRIYLAGIKRLLRPSGDFFISTPNKLWSEQFQKSGKPLNPFHVREYYPRELGHLLENYFDITGCFVRFTVGDYDQRRLEWAKYMSTCPVPTKFQRKSPNIVKHGIRASYSRLLQVLGHPPPSELRGKYYLNRIEPVKGPEEIDKRFPEQLWWVTKKR